jgi:Kef-type K+ transport system membrane component KefB
VLSATSVGIVIPVLKDADQVSTQFGQLVVAGASIAEIATIVLLSLFFSEETSSVGVRLVLLGLFGLFVVAVGVAVLGAEHSLRISATLLRLQDTTAEIRIRASFLLLAVFVKDRACVDVCPVDCIHEFERILIIDSEECIDC